MKKIVFLSLMALCLPWALAAQSVADDLYYVPSKKEKAEKKNHTPKKETVVVTPADEVVVKSDAPMSVHASEGQTTVVVRDAKGNARDVDEYNRRYDASDYEFTAQNDTLYIDEKPDDGLDGEWVGGEFQGSADDYEYATRIIRFRNPRYAISISSPLYFDVVYGLNTWDWNVYYDGLYAYAFPTFTNRLWWDWRFNSYGWWGYPYYGWSSWYSPWYDPWYWGGGWAWHHPHWHHPHWGWSGRPHHWGNAYTARRSYGVRGGASGARRPSLVNGGNVRRSSAVRQSTARTTSGRRVVGTRSSSSRRSSATTRSGVSSSTRRTTSYTRPSRVSTVRGGTGVRRSSSTTGSSTLRRSSATYNRGSSTSTRTNTYNNMRNTTTRSRSYSTPSRSSSSRSSFSTGGGSFRSSGSARSGGSRSGGGARRR